ncbi:hypothetical protein BDV93DRAFT_258340 [Ceratobasidium sp. AG-I]|nr:hypothetical protein BDV93DRAFT_258340 [Ceratobasidium sp. AG-I]
MLCGWKDGTEVLVTRWENGQAVFWETDARQVRKGRPIWENSFDLNWEEFGDDLMKIFGQQAKKSPYAKYLATQSAEEVRARMKELTWSTYRAIVGKKTKGIYDEARVKKNVNTLENARQKELLAARAGARKGSCVEGEDCDSLFLPCAQSPQLSDVEGSGQLTRIQPAYFSDEVARI